MSTDVKVVSGEDVSGHGALATTVACRVHTSSDTVESDTFPCETLQVCYCFSVKSLA